VPLLPQAAVSIVKKAERLLLEGRVTIPAYSASVRGDHDTHSVFREGSRWRCTCPSRKKCSHIEAVERVT
jgi:hypothetical protein